MEPINRTLKRMITNPSFATRMEEMKKEVVENRDVQDFLQAHSSEVSPAVLETSMSKLYEYIEQTHDCDRCPNVAGCVNLIKGFEPKLVMGRGRIELDYLRCRNGRIEDERQSISAMIHSMHMPKDVLAATFSNVELNDESRFLALRAANNFIKSYKETHSLPEKGFYVHGPFGVGKSYILGAIANELADLQIATVLVYVPEFLREMRQSIQENSLAEKMEVVKNAPVLMLDDLGAETMSSWTRDDIIGTILQHRMAQGLPTFISSNFTYDELKHHFTTTQRGEKEPVKAGRILERIKALTTPIELQGINWRESN
ncbi:primosomal protein DnaI [Chryseomicrobium sp. FSL W7-1435]|uniref:primosomal protein DnaI n=1 Tax=Chryseomicrobium sp. FSL W7-1435 TaxID=2921704 RepID=UPI003159C4AD